MIVPAALLLDALSSGKAVLVSTTERPICTRILAPKVAGSSPVGHPMIHKKYRNPDSLANPHFAYHYLHD